MGTEKKSEKVESNSKSTKKPKEITNVVILNRTNQKQVVEHKGKITVFLAGEKKTFTKDVKSVLESFKYYIDSNILKQIS